MGQYILVATVLGVALIAAFLVWVLRRAVSHAPCRKGRSALRWVSAVGVPFVVAYCTYWVPAWLSGSDRAQYDAWAPLGIGVMFLPALLVSLFVAARAEPRAVESPQDRQDGPRTGDSQGSR